MDNKEFLGQPGITLIAGNIAVFFLSLTRCRLLLGSLLALLWDVTNVFSYHYVTFQLLVGKNNSAPRFYHIERSSCFIDLRVKSMKIWIWCWSRDCFQALLDVLQQEQPELAEAAATMTQQQRENWLQQLSNKINALDPGMVFVIS